MTMTDFGDPIAITEMPPQAVRGGRQSNEPALIAWLEKVSAAAPGTYELKSSDPDGAHPVSRGTQMRNLIKTNEAITNVAVETRAVVTGKRYRIFATKTAPAKPNGRK